jgi:hypothetical protein
MPATYRIDVRAGVVFSMFEEHVTNEELLDHQQRMSADPDFRPTMNQVIDARGVTEVSVTAFGVRLVATPSIFARDRVARSSRAAPPPTPACSRPYAVRAARTPGSSRRSRTRTAGSDWSRPTTTTLTPDRRLPHHRRMDRRRATRPKSKTPEPDDAARVSGAGSGAVLPMDLRVGDRFTEQGFEWEVVSRPEVLHGAKNIRARVLRPGLPESEREITWPAHVRVAIQRGR